MSYTKKTPVQKVLDFITNNPGANRTAIVTATKLEPTEVSVALHALHLCGLVKMRGERRGATYQAK